MLAIRWSNDIPSGVIVVEVGADVFGGCAKAIQKRDFRAPAQELLGLAQVR